MQAVIIYICIVSFCYALSVLTFLNKKNSQWIQLYVFILLALFFTLFFGLRVVQPFTDTYYYINYFNGINSIHDIFFGDSSWKGDYFFFSFGLIGAPLTSLFGENGYLLLISFISISVALYSIWCIFGKNTRLVIAMLFISTSTFIALYSNLLRQGLALSFFLLSLAMIVRKKYWFALIFFVFSFFTHKSVFLFVFSLPLFLFKWEVRRKIMLVLLVFSAFLSKINIITYVGITFVSDKVEIYSEASSSTLIFKLLTILPLILISLTFFSSKLSKVMEAILTVVVTMVCFVILFMDLELFANRFLFNASFFIPLIIGELIFYFRQRSYIYVCLFPLSLAYIMVISFYSNSLAAIYFNYF